MDNVRKIEKSDLIFREKLGEGHMGRVDRAIWKKYNREVAIKYCKTGSDTVIDHEKLKKESMRLEKLQHPNIVELYGIVVDKGDFMGVAVEYLPCGNLSDAIARLKNAERNLPWPLKIRIIYEIAQALEYMHISSEFVHKDLKAANIMLSEDFHTKLVDFELSRPKDTETAPLDWLCGTPGFMGPELVADTTLIGKYHTQSDVYSFAVTMYEIMSEQQCPYEGLLRTRANAAEIMQAVAKNVRPSIDKIKVDSGDPVTDNNIRKVLIPLMESCWHENPDKRPKANEIALKVRQVYEYEPLKEAAERFAKTCAQIVKESIARSRDILTQDGPQPILRNDQKVNIGNQYTVVNHGNALPPRQRKWVKLTEEEAREKLDLQRNNIYLRHENAPVSTDHLSAVAKLLGTDTKLLAPCLLIKDGELDNIVYNNQAFGLEEINTKMLLKWSEKPTATYKWLATACLSLGRMDLINILNQRD